MRKGFIEIKTKNLILSVGDQSIFVPLTGDISFPFNFENPFTLDNVFVNKFINQTPSLIP